MVDYAQLSKLDTTKLTSASEASGTFSTAISGRGEAVRTKSEIPAGMWAGGDANAAGSLLAGMSDPLFDVSDSANRGKKTLEDLVTALGDAKEHLQGAHDAIKGTGITIDAKGKVTTPVVNDPGLAAENDRKAQDAADIITEALKMANDADKTATDDLNSLAGTTAASYMEIPGKKEQLDQAAALLNTPREDITPEKARQLSELLKNNKNPEFARQLMEKIGPKGLLEGSANYSGIGSMLHNGGDPAAQDFKDLQQQLGESLALASQDGGLSPEWTQDLMNRGAQPLENNPSQTGYRALAPLLEHGNYDKSFLTPVAEHMTRLEKDAINGGNSALMGRGGMTNPYMIGEPTMESNNPLNSVMTALDHSPEAAADYFNGTNDEHGLKYTDGAGRELESTGDPAKNPNIDYNLNKAGGDAPGMKMDMDRLGGALESAATGVPSEAKVDALPPRTQEMANVAQQLAHRFGAGEGSLDLRPGGDFEAMADNMSDMAQAYMGDINNSMLENPVTGEVEDEDKHLIIPAEGVSADFNRQDSEALLHSLGRHTDEAYELLGANEAAREAALTQNFEKNGGNPIEVGEALEPSAKVTEILKDGAGDGFEKTAAEADEAHNDKVGYGASTAKVAASMLPGPAGAFTSEVIDKVKDDLEANTVDQSVQGSQALTAAMGAHDEEVAERVAEGLAARYGITDASYEDAVEKARNDARSELGQLLDDTTGGK